MATFVIEFASNRDDEQVDAEFYADKPPFVDFMTHDAGNLVTVARYRQEDISRILRK